MREINEHSKNDPDFAAQKLAKVFVNYGHASVADLATPLLLSIEGITMEEALTIFNIDSRQSGQELSTRYVKIGEFKIPKLRSLINSELFDAEKLEELEAEWDDLQKFLAENYEIWTKLLTDKLKKFINDEIQKQNHPQKLTQSTLNARVLDISRGFIPIGARTAMVINTTVRQHITNIAQLRDHQNDVRMQALATQIETLLNIRRYAEGEKIQLNFEGLTKYAEGTKTVPKNLQELKDFLEKNTNIKKILKPKDQIQGSETLVYKISNFDAGEALALSYISVLYPSVNENEILKFISKLDKKTKSKIGEIILKDHNHHNLMQRIGDVRGQLILVSKTSVAYIRDLNRQRATGRLIHMIESSDVESILKEGFHINFQLVKTRALSDLVPKWIETFETYYKKVWEFYSKIDTFLEPKADRTFIYNILPLAHSAKMHMSAPPTQWVYLTSLRLGHGADFGYKYWVYLMLEELRKDNSFFANLHSKFSEPDPNSLDEILGRS
ncbi:MAG: hypothetical protein KatS3mg085_271 [Candidatus Dojkabacteria bacterium]|nr:MAG: hypothetical protein KatS3mg085_271 [Candidatus Dojkabacteria bacterium]